MKKLVAAFALLVLAACTTVGSVIGPTPEAQIANGATAHTAATTLATSLLKNDRITVAQAKSFRVLLGASSTALDDANVTLLACRKATGSSSTARPDPCQPGVSDVIRLALDGIANVRRTLEAK